MALFYLRMNDIILDNTNFSDSHTDFLLNI
jgi:hypothetical protein